MNNNLVSNDNLKTILQKIGVNIIDTIDKKDITGEQKKILEKSNIIDSTTNNSSFLSDNGKYNKIEVDKVNDIDIKTNKVYELFNIKENNNEEWVAYNNNMPTPRNGLTSQLYGAKIYCIGGSTNISPTNILEVYDIESDTWSTKQSMVNRSNDLTSQLYNGKIYCIGGCNEYGYTLRIVEIYDIETDTWGIGNNMPTCRSGLTSQLYNGKIYCIGGCGENGNNFNIIEVYDISTNTWTSVKPMINKRYGLTSQLYNGKIYCIGGYNGSCLNDVEIYNISTNTWSIGKSMPTTKYYLSSVIINNKIYCIGGYTDKDTNIVEIYDITKDTWITGKSTPTAIYGLTSQLYNGKIYCIGGIENRKILGNVYALILSYTDYNIKLPSIIQDKLDIINEKGDGSKILSDKGEYIDIPKGYRFMNENEVSEFVSNMKEYLK